MSNWLNDRIVLLTKGPTNTLIRHATGSNDWLIEWRVDWFLRGWLARVPAWFFVSSADWFSDPVNWVNYAIDDWETIWLNRWLAGSVIILKEGHNLKRNVWGGRGGVGLRRWICDLRDIDHWTGSHSSLSLKPLSHNLLSSGMWRRTVRQKFTEFSHEFASCIISVNYGI
jgi:hypothetical protein